jgi:protein-S-isoprenylcysteine O-methyltransferase Ste14
VALFPRHDLSIGLNLLSAGLIVVGHLLAVYALAWLGRSFSIMAEARRLVTDGPYAVVRHPLYSRRRSPRSRRFCNTPRSAARF